MVVVRGTLPAHSAPRKLVLAISRAGRARGGAADAAARRARREDRRESAAVHIPDIAARSPRAVLAEHVSIPLGDSVKLVNKISQNLHTEMLLRTAARQDGTWATPEDLAKFPVDFYAAAGIAAGDVVQADGSGLSRHDLVTPRAVVALLKYAKRSRGLRRTTRRCRSPGSMERWKTA